jgi:hypothetical protein
MSELKRVGSLEIDQDERFERREAVVQRVATWTILLILILAMLGLFGHGVLSSTEAVSSKGELAVKYQRFGRLQTPLSYQIRIQNLNPNPESEIGLEINQEFIRTINIIHMEPEPERVEITPTGLLYFFKMQSNSGEVVFETEPESMGLQKVRIKILNGSEATFTQWIYP